METIHQDTTHSSTDSDLIILCDMRLLAELESLPDLYGLEKLGLKAKIGLQTNLLGPEEWIPPLLIILRDIAFAVLTGTAGAGLWDELKKIIAKLQSVHSNQTGKESSPDEQSAKYIVRIRIIEKHQETIIDIPYDVIRNLDIKSIIDCIRNPAERKDGIHKQTRTGPKRK